MEFAFRMDLAQLLLIIVGLIGIPVSNIIVIKTEKSKVERENLFRWNNHKQEAYIKFIGALELLEFYSITRRKKNGPAVSLADAMRIYQDLDHATTTIAIVACNEVAAKTSDLQKKSLKRLYASFEPSGKGMEKAHSQKFTDDMVTAKKKWVNTVRRDLGLEDLNEATLQAFTGSVSQEGLLGK